MAWIIIVDDDREVAKSIRKILCLEGYHVSLATNAKQAKSLLLKGIYDVAIIDLCMPDIGGLEMLATCRKIDPAIAILMLTAYGTVDSATKAFKLGAKDFLTKPVRREDLLAAVQRALDNSRLVREGRRLRNQLIQDSSFEAIIGNSRELHEAIGLARKVAPSDIPVVIRGETGTGKGLLATAIHRASPRRNHSFVTAVIAADVEELQKSTLFGHVKGSFTGAISSHRGFFQEAECGTIFLDEIADISLQTQVLLLRAIDERQIRPIGADHDINVDVRIISATNRDLGREVKAKRFREDLYYRIGGVFIDLPPLRKRKEDIPLLIAYFAREFKGKDSGALNIDPGTLEALGNYEWPGNVRELKKVIELAILLSKGDTIRYCHCFPQSSMRPTNYYDLPMKEAYDQFAADYLKRLLDLYEGNIKMVAKHAQMHEKSISRKIRELRIEV